MFLRDLPRIFTWEEAAPELVRLHRSYLALLAERVAQLVAALRGPGGADELSDELLDLLQRIPNEDLARTLAAPEVSYRLLWPAHHDRLEAARFVVSALRTADAAARALPRGEISWIADGHAYLDPSGAVVEPWGCPGGLPLDYGSPYALATDVSGERIRAGIVRPPLAPDEVAATHVLLQRAVEATRAAVPHAWTMASTFTKALILLPDPDAPAQFSSGSSGQFVGRSVFANPQLPKVTEVHLAEALVHEAIHAVLYMDEQHDAWVLDPALYAGPIRITSPWTGNRLPLRPFLQAAFVWYGLLSFWARAREAGAFADTLVRERLNECCAGFLRVDLLAQVASVRDSLAPELVEALGELQQGVRALLAPEVA